MIFILRKSWEFQAETLEDAKALLRRYKTQAPEGFVETSEDLSIAEESLEKHWNMHGE